jgi:predicted nucleotidyltransferase
MAKKTETANQFRFVFCIPAHAMPIHNDDIAKVFEEIADLLDIRGENPFRVHALHYDLDIHTPEQLYRAAKDGRLRELPGFGPKTEAAIVSALEAHLSAARRFKLATAARYAEPLAAWLESTEGVDRVVVAGSYRRSRETVGDLDILVTAAEAEPIMKRSDLRGHLHCHTVATDGHGTLEKMAKAAQEQGLEYLAITEHSKRLTMVHGLDSRRLLQQMDRIEGLNEKLKGFRVLKGIEVDILEDGGLDLPDAVLGRLDLVVGAVHSKFHLTRAQQTRRILKAMDRYPLMHTSGSSCATLRARPAASAASTTASTSL